ncbi:hypothetical protein AAFF_G00367570, partial [Aldrovandia affinis]
LGNQRRKLLCAIALDCLRSRPVFDPRLPDFPLPSPILDCLRIRLRVPNPAHGYRRFYCTVDWTVVLQLTSCSCFQ